MSQKTSEPRQNDKIVCSDPPYDSPLVSFDGTKVRNAGISPACSRKFGVLRIVSIEVAHVSYVSLKFVLQKGGIFRSIRKHWHLWANYC